MFKKYRHCCIGNRDWRLVAVDREHRMLQSTSHPEDGIDYGRCENTLVETLSSDCLFIGGPIPLPAWKLRGRS